MKELILDAAEKRARRGGYNSFSFRELAEDVGIKSASIHYHFPTKEFLVQILVERYLNHTEMLLGDPTKLSPRAAVKHLSDIFINANETNNQMCLCGIFAAQTSVLPQQVVVKIVAFFEMILKWLNSAFQSDKQTPNALEVISILEGSLLLSRVMQDPNILRVAVKALLKRLSHQKKNI